MILHRIICKMKKGRSKKYIVQVHTAIGIMMVVNIFLLLLSHNMFVFIISHFDIKLILDIALNCMQSEIQ